MSRPVRAITALVVLATSSVVLPALSVPFDTSAAAEVADVMSTPTTVHVSQTTSDLSDRMTTKADVILDSAVEGSLSIDTAQRYQTIDGFGAAFTDTSTYLLDQLSSVQRATVMEQLFTTDDGGAGFSFMRMPMGASDFTATPVDDPAPYSYDDTGTLGEPGLPRFSVEHDRDYIIPIIKQAQALNPDMRLMANPWSPPAWMKNNNTMLGTGDPTLRAEAYQAYANYYVKFLQAYEAAGVEVWGVSPGNEPDISPDTYPSMEFPPADAARWIAENLAPSLDAAGLDTKIIGGDTTVVNVPYMKTLMDNADARAEVYGLAGHCYVGDFGNFGTATENLRSLFPEVRLYESECSTGPTGIAPLNAAMTTLASVYNGVSGVQLWNLALDPNGGPKIGQGCNGCTGLVTVDPDTDSATYTANYYQLAQFSRFIRPGATRVGSTDDGSDWAQAFENTDGSKALVAHNTTTADRTFTVNWDGEGSFDYTLPGGATVTFYTDATKIAPTFTPGGATPDRATVGEAYTFLPTVTATPAPTFALASGDLPPGLSLDTGTGAVSGTPTTAGSYSFRLSASNGVGEPVISDLVTIVVDPVTAAGPTPQTKTKLRLSIAAKAAARGVSIYGLAKPGIKVRVLLQRRTAPAKFITVDGIRVRRQKLPNGKKAMGYVFTMRRETFGVYRVVFRGNDKVAPFTSRAITVRRHRTR